MTKPILLDTDVLVDYLRGDERALAYIKENATHIVLSAIGVAELYAGAKGETELSDLDEFVSLFPVLPVSRQIAKVGGLYRQEFSGSHGVALADALVAATAEIHGAHLKTFNVKHFPMLKGLKPPYRKS